MAGGRWHAPDLLGSDPSMATYDPTVESGIDYEPRIQIRCVECGYVHTDERFTACRECGAQL